MNATTDHSHCISVCNRLLRGELSAVETYDQIVDRFAGETEAVHLGRIRDEHASAVARLQNNVLAMGGTPSTESGSWGTFASCLQGTANLFGEKSAMTVIQHGESHGQHDYENALEDEGVMDSCKELIRTELLPKIKEHLATLDRLSKW